VLSKAKDNKRLDGDRAVHPLFDRIFALDDVRRTQVR